MSDIDSLKREIQEANNNYESSLSDDEKLLLEIMKVERRFLYGIDSSTQQRRRERVKELITEAIKRKQGSTK